MFCRKIASACKGFPPIMAGFKCVKYGYAAYAKIKAVNNILSCPGMNLILGLKQEYTEADSGGVIVV